MTAESKHKYSVFIQPGIYHNTSGDKLYRYRMLLQWVLANRHNGVDWNENIGRSDINGQAYYSEILFEHQHDRTACILLFSDVLS